MPKIKTSESLSGLFQLIRTLTPGQKRSFKKYTHIWGLKNDRKYLLLYELISRYAKTEGDGNGLLVFIKKQAEFGRRSIADISKTAHYLMDGILESQRTNPERNQGFTHLCSLLQDVYFLFHKSLFQECYHVLKKAQNLAIRLDRHAQMLELALIERRIINSVHTSSGLHKKIEALNIQEAWLRRQVDLYYRFNDLFYTLRTFHARNEMLPPDLDETLFNWSNISKEAQLDFSPRTNIRYCIMMSTYFDQISLYPGDRTIPDSLMIAWTYSGKVITIFEKNTALLEEDEWVYNNALDYYINLCVRTRNETEMTRCLNKINKSNNTVLKVSIYGFHKLLSLLHKKNYAEALSYIEKEQVEALLLQHKSQLNETRLLALWFTCIKVFFMLERFDSVYTWCQYVIHEPRSESRPDIKIQAQLLSAIAFYETDRSRIRREVLKRALENVRSSLRRTKKLGAFEKKLLNALELFFLQPITLTKTRITRLFQYLNDEIKQTNRLRLYAFELTWLGARLSKRSLQEVMNEYEDL